MHILSIFALLNFLMITRERVWKNPSEIIEFSESIVKAYETNETVKS